MTITKVEADCLAITFLREHGPHTLPSPLSTTEEMCAAFTFLDLHKRGLVSKINYGNGRVQFTVTPAGIDFLDRNGAPA